MIEAAQILQELARSNQAGDLARREQADQDRAEIFYLGGLTTADLLAKAQAVWDSYWEKHLALRGGYDQQIWALEQSGNGEPLWSQQLFEAADLVRILAVLWQRGETWAPAGPVRAG